MSEQESLTLIVGIVCSNPKQYMLLGNPFDFIVEFDKWFWYECEKKFQNRHWFNTSEIPVDRCTFGA